MGKNTKIEWTATRLPDGTVRSGHTWNCWRGCHKISTGCAMCYMFRDQKRYGNDPNIVIRAADKTFNAPLKWKESAFVFANSWSDFFIEEADEWRNDAWKIIKATPHLTYQILTKRPERIRECLQVDDCGALTFGQPYYPKNVWPGVSTENQETADRRIPILLSQPAALHFVSVEPMLEEINLRPWLYETEVREEKCYPWTRKIGWVICGGESGPNARPMNLKWATSLRDQCRAAKVPFFFKQVGGYKKIDGAWGGDKLEGKQHQEMPEVYNGTDKKNKELF